MTRAAKRRGDDDPTVAERPIRAEDYIGAEPLVDDPPPMTRAEALAEAVRRWPGRKVEVAFDPLLGAYVVGPSGKGFGDVCGIGPTWEAAFTDADRREAETHHGHCQCNVCCRERDWTRPRAERGTK